MTTASARQYSLGLEPAPARLARRDFVVSESNAAALETLLQWSASAEPLLIVAGPQASGKTHLLHILAETAGAFVEGAGGGLRPLIGSLRIVDDIPAGLAPLTILTRIEQAREKGEKLALAGKGDPLSWSQGLRDLETRLGAATRIDLVEPDEALLQAVIVKLLGDRQLRAGRDLATYAAARLPKTFAAAQAFVASLDAASIAGGSPVGLRLARGVIANLSEEPQPA